MGDVGVANAKSGKCHLFCLFLNLLPTHQSYLVNGRAYHVFGHPIISPICYL